MNDAFDICGRAILKGSAAFVRNRLDRTRETFRRLLAHHGPQHWWPAETRFEVIAGALLMQQTSWRNVEQALENLKRAGLLEPHRLARAPVSTIREHVRVAGLYRTKPERLKAFCRHLVDRSDGNLDRYFHRPTDDVRKDLLAQTGVGPETADSILLYAGGHMVFVVDAYTIRIARRIGLIESDDTREAQAFFERHLSRDVSMYREDHALLVAHAKTICRPKPRCGECPLLDLCDVGRGRKG